MVGISTKRFFLCAAIENRMRLRDKFRVIGLRDRAKLFSRFDQRFNAKLKQAPAAIVAEQA